MARATADRSALLKVLRERYVSAGSERWNAADFLYERGSVPSALLYTAIFLPQFVEVEGEVFFEELGVQPQDGRAGLAERVRLRRRESAEALKVFVDSCNWLEVPYLVGQDFGAEAEITVLAGLLVEAWDARLRAQYPERRFRVRVLPQQETGGAIGVGFEMEA